MKHKLHADSITKVIKGRTLLDHVMLQCETGEVIGLLGRNGSGKSTLLKIIFGTMRATDRFVIINNTDHKRFSESEPSIAYLPQHPFLPPSFSVKKAINLFLNINESDIFYEDGAIATLVNKKVHQLSGGELRYLEAKLILSSKAKFVLLDEPFTELAPVVVDNLKKLIGQSSATKGIIISDHKYHDVMDVASKNYLLKDGKAVFVNGEDDLKMLGYL